MSSTVIEKDVIETPPESCMRPKFRGLSYSICPRCHRMSCVVKSPTAQETLVVAPHKSIWDCLHELALYPNYKDTLPLELRTQKIPGIWEYYYDLLTTNWRQLNMDFLRSSKDKALTWFVFKLLMVMHFVSKGLGKSSQHHIRQWVPRIVSLGWGKVK
jgi:hypothetical protein